MKTKGDDTSYDLSVNGDQTVIHPRMPKSTKGTSGSLRYLSLAGQLGFDIAVPMVVGLIVGRWLDDMWRTAPTYTIGLFSFGCVIGCTSLIRIVQDVTRRR